MQLLNINLDRPIEKVDIIGSQIDSDRIGTAKTNHHQQNGDQSGPETQQKKTELTQLCSVLKNIIETLSQFQDSAFATHKEDIAKLAVEIARRVLAQKVQEGDYEIEKIIRQALENLTVKHDAVVRLNPADHTRIEQLLKDAEFSDFKGLAFVPDEKIRQAECVLETQRGTIEALIEEKLQRIAEALKKAQ
ncbi:MAG: FliH/SctL family protein [Phycisphaerales bacterium]|jgi:flagellar biosynthesis/type III secretory pathway protein FliH